jgi:hypothetical protein
MTLLGLLLLGVSWTLLTIFTAWCLFKILTAPFKPEDFEPPHTG